MKMKHCFVVVVYCSRKYIKIGLNYVNRRALNEPSTAPWSCVCSSLWPTHSPAISQKPFQSVVAAILCNLFGNFMESNIIYSCGSVL